MGNIYVPVEEDFKRWVREAVKECIENYFEQHLPQTLPWDEEPLRSRLEIARMFNVSLVTLNSWTKKGLPAHKQGGRVYYLRSEVLNYIKEARGIQS